MEGQTKPTDRLKFIESKRKVKVENKIVQPHVKLVTAANNHNLLLIGCEDNTIKYIDTSQLFDFTANQPQILTQPATILASLTFRPTLISVSRYGYSSILLVAGVNSFPKYPVIEVFNLDSRSSIDRINLSDLSDTEIVDYAWHPNYYNSLVALCTNKGHLLVLAINKQDKGIGIVYRNEQYAALTCCWSMKGKNLAIGTQRGQILRLEPVVGDNSFSFKEVNGSNITFANPKITADHQLVRLRWINSKYLIATHAKPNNPSNPETVYSLTTVKPGKPYLYWTNVNFESQASSSYVVQIANLSNSVICISSATGEAATIGVLGANQAATNELNDWSSLIIEEEGARIELPLDANNTETHPCGLTMTTWPQDGRPILIFYTNDGLICSYAVMHSENILKFPEHLSQPEQEFTYKPQKSSAPTSIFSSSFSSQPSLFQTPALGATGTAFSSTGPKFGGMASFSAGITPPVTNAPTSLFGVSMPSKFEQLNQKEPESTNKPQMSSAPTSIFSSTFGTQPSLFQAPALGTLGAAFSSTGPKSEEKPSLSTSTASPITTAPTSLFSWLPTPAPSSTSLAAAATPSSTSLAAAPTPSSTSLAAALTPSTTSLTAAPAAASTAAPAPSTTSLAAAPVLSSTNPLAKPATFPTSFLSTIAPSSANSPATSAPFSTSFSAAPALFSTSLSATPAPFSTSLSATPGPSLMKPQATPSLSTTSLSAALASSSTSLAASLASTLTKPSAAPALCSTSAPSTAAPSSTIPSATAEANTSGCALSTSLLSGVRDNIQSVREKLDFNGAYISLFEEVNHLRDRFDETLDLHKAHHEALDVVKEDIDHLDLEVLETFYLIEYVKSRISCDIKKKSIDPMTAKKVNNIKMKLKTIGTKLEELSDHVDNAWEDFVRRRSTKARRTVSLDAIYKALATNQKILNVYKKKVGIAPEKPLAVKKISANLTRMEQQQDSSRFEEFLAARSVVPVRQPVSILR